MPLQGCAPSQCLLATYFCLWATRKCGFLHQTCMLGALDVKGLEAMGSQLIFVQYGLAFILLPN